MTRRLLLLAALAACGGGGGDADCALPGDGPGVDPDGELCERLSSYRLFEDLAAQRPAEGLIPYDVATPLFSDYTTKLRFVWLPPGTTMTWHDTDAFALPVGAVVVKTFGYLHDRRDPSLGLRLLETRLLVRGTDSWRGVSYVYDEDGADARRAIAGAFVDASWIHDDGAERTNHYAVPNQNQCKNCHAAHDDTLDVLGPKARLLNRPGPEGSGVANQLQTLIDRGALAGAPPPASWPRGVAVMDPASGTLEERARAWLDVSCGHCHNARGGAARTSGLYLDLAQTDLHELGLCKAPVAAGRGSGGRRFGIVPGQPDASILVFRIESTEADVKMPELGRNLVDAEGVALIRQWIAQLPGSCP
ncbi:MAG TPA: SO2930 family diheme c-type cytochrome [Kofleriaceae bacterium]|nr:SO2930 family diheme c-type cytochrome [Kofleriaceae bacterium]